MPIAFCRLRDDFRAFRLDCIQSLVVAFESFEPHDMTIEATLCKLNYLLTHYRETIQQKLSENLKGELSICTGKEKHVQSLP